jgi:hypothetical protein
VGDEPLCTLARVHFAELHDAETVNRRLAPAFVRQKHAPHVRRSHQFFGRFENIYIDAEYLPELTPVSDLALRMARSLLGTSALRHGFWFNEMQPGQRTSLHSHEELDECLSAVYYVTCPDDSGRLILHDDEAKIVIDPRPGLLVLFPPDLPHEVEENRGRGTRLSVAFNFGPPNSET